MSNPSLDTRTIETMPALTQAQLQQSEVAPVSTDFFRVGTPLQLTVSEKGAVRSAYSVTLGFRSSRFILVELPTIDNRAMVVTAGTPVRVRYLLDGMLLGLSCESIKAQFSPERLLFLSYPRRVEQLALRRHERVRVALPTLLRVEGQARHVKAEARDLSVSGCGLVVGREGPAIGSGNALTVCFQTPGENTLREAHAWARTIKRRRDGSSWVGCEFDFQAGEEETKTMVERIVLARTGLMSTSDLDLAE